MILNGRKRNSFWLRGSNGGHECSLIIFTLKTSRSRAGLYEPTIAFRYRIYFNGRCRSPTTVEYCLKSRAFRQRFRGRGCTTRAIWQGLLSPSVVYTFLRGKIFCFPWRFRLQTKHKKLTYELSIIFVNVRCFLSFYLFLLFFLSPTIYSNQFDAIFNRFPVIATRVESYSEVHSHNLRQLRKLEWHFTGSAHPYCVWKITNILHFVFETEMAFQTSTFKPLMTLCGFSFYARCWFIAVVKEQIINGRNGFYDYLGYDVRASVKRRSSKLQKYSIKYSKR